MSRTKWLNRREASAWLGYMRMRALLDLQIGRDLASDSDLSAADYQVLATLSETDGQQLRLIDLAERMLWSKSRLGHHLDRMAARGLVRRDTHPSNSRAAVISLTDDGLHTIERAAPAHVGSVRRHFIDLLTQEEIEALATATDKVVDHLHDLREEQS